MESKQDFSQTSHQQTTAVTVNEKTSKTEKLTVREDFNYPCVDWRVLEQGTVQPFIAP